MNSIQKIFTGKWFLSTLFVFASLFITSTVYAEQSLGTVASNVTGSFEDVAKLITAGAYIAGLAFAVAAIMKFKQHKDNPTQIPIGTPIALLFIAAALIFLTTIFGVTGATLFGSSGAEKVAGAKGTAWTNK